MPWASWCDDFAGRDLPRLREIAALAQTVKGAASGEARKLLGSSARTVEFHRANLVQELGAKNVAELIRLVLESPGSAA
jgi:FixJ family two-component response regulator